MAEFIWGSRKGESWSLTSAVDNASATIDFKVGPNPATHTIYVDTNESGISYSIRTTVGHTLAHQVLDYSKKIDVSTLSNGIYIIQLHKGNTTTTKKFIINK